MIEEVWSDRAFFTPLCWCFQMRLLHSKHRTQERSSSLLHPCPWFSSMAQPCIPWKWWRSAFPEENWPGLWFFCLFIGEKARKTILIYIGGNREVSGIPFFTPYIITNKLSKIMSAALLITMLNLFFQVASEKPGENGKFKNEWSNRSEYLLYWIYGVKKSFAVFLSTWRK